MAERLAGQGHSGTSAAWGRHLALRALFPLWVALLVATGGCSSAEWVAVGQACVRESGDDVTQRVINYSDPELCERKVKVRSPVYLRVSPP